MHRYKINETHVEDFKASDVKDSDEKCLFSLCRQSCVAFLDDPLEELVKDGLAEASDGEIDLVFVSTLCHKLIANLDLRFQQIPVEIVRVEIEQLCDFLTLLKHGAKIISKPTGPEGG